VDKVHTLDFNCWPVAYWKTYFKSLLRIGLPLFVLTVIGAVMDQWITGRMEDMLLNPTGTSRLIWLYGGFSMMWSLLYPLMGLLLILWTVQSRPFLTFWSESFPQAMIEIMRSWGKSMTWSFLFIIPGLIRFIQYLFVPLIVCLDPQYGEGRREALEHSRALSKGQLARLAGFFVLTTMLVPGLLTSFDEWKIFSVHPASALGISAFEMLLNLGFSLWLFRIYQRSSVI
jgi:hypothetical protein